MTGPIQPELVAYIKIWSQKVSSPLSTCLHVHTKTWATTSCTSGLASKLKWGEGGYTFQKSWTSNGYMCNFAENKRGLSPPSPHPRFRRLCVRITCILMMKFDLFNTCICTRLWLFYTARYWFLNQISTTFFGFFKNWFTVLFKVNLNFYDLHINHWKYNIDAIYRFTKVLNCVRHCSIRAVR